MRSKRNLSASPDSITDKNIADINHLERQALLNRTPSERLAGKVTRFAGGVMFISIHVIWFLFWIILNVGAIPRIEPWDPFPFSFLTLVVSLEAIFLSLLVLMTQNRLTKDADKRAHLDLQINMLAEEESTATLQMLEKICKHLGIPYEADEAQQLAKATDVIKIAKTLDERIQNES